MIETDPTTITDNWQNRITVSLHTSASSLVEQKSTTQGTQRPEICAGHTGKQLKNLGTSLNFPVPVSSSINW